MMCCFMVLNYTVMSVVTNIIFLTLMEAKLCVGKKLISNSYTVMNSTNSGFSCLSVVCYPKQEPTFKYYYDELH